MIVNFYNLFKESISSRN